MFAPALVDRSGTGRAGLLPAGHRLAVAPPRFPPMSTGRQPPARPPPRVSSWNGDLHRCRLRRLSCLSSFPSFRFTSPDSWRGQYRREAGWRVSPILPDCCPIVWIDLRQLTYAAKKKQLWICRCLRREEAPVPNAIALACDEGLAAMNSCPENILWECFPRKIKMITCA